MFKSLFTKIVKIPMVANLMNKFTNKGAYFAETASLKVFKKVDKLGNVKFTSVDKATNNVVKVVERKSAPRFYHNDYAHETTVTNYAKGTKTVIDRNFCKGETPDFETVEYMIVKPFQRLGSVTSDLASGKTISSLSLSTGAPRVEMPWTSMTRRKGLNVLNTFFDNETGNVTKNLYLGNSNRVISRTFDPASPSIGKNNYGMGRLAFGRYPYV